MTTKSTLSNPRFMVVVFALLIISFLMLFYVYKGAHEESMAKPVIGIMLNDGGKGGYSDYPWYAIRQNYSRVVTHYGGIPVFIGHDVEAVDDYVKILDGILLTGGDFQSPPEVFASGIPDKHQKRYSRDMIEYALVKKSYEKDIPTLGICAGMQNMNIALGGTLIENLKNTLGTPIQHRNENREQVQHTIQIHPNTKLAAILKTAQLQVNSNHNAGLNKVSPQFIVTAKAPDGVVEGIEVPSKRFFIGVMWHPEFVLSNEENELWQAFIAAATEYKKENN